MHRRADSEPTILAQGGILRPHGRQFSYYLFFTFKDLTKDRLRAWLQLLAMEITTEKQQGADAEKYKKTNKADQPFLTIGLTEEGWNKLGGEDSTSSEFSPFSDAVKYGNRNYNEVAEYSGKGAKGRSPKDNAKRQQDGVIVLANDVLELIERKIKKNN